MAGRAEGHLLRRLGRIRVLRVVSGHQPSDVDEVGLGRRLPGPIIHLHGLLLLPG
jgi:hypothetical protein